ncbi:MAG: hypothetical protein Q8900_01420 [Bacillota bacterium]|nr:hypothetical protein [Bacillota bacterium]
MKKTNETKEHKNYKKPILITLLSIFLVAACILIVHFSKPTYSNTITQKNLPSVRNDGVDDAPSSGIYWKGGTGEGFSEQNTTASFEIAANDQATKDKLSNITWSISGTDIKGTGSPVTFKATMNVGQYTITATLGNDTITKTLTIIK